MIAIVATVFPALSSAGSATAGGGEATLTTGAGVSEPGPTVTLGRIATYATGTHLVTADVVVEHTSEDPVHLVSVSLGCRDKNGVEQRMGQYMNTLSAARVSRLEPHLIFHATGDFTCWVAARGMRMNAGDGVSGEQEITVRSASLAVDRVHYRSRASDVHDPLDKTVMLGESRLVRSGTNAVATSARTDLLNPAATHELKVRGALQLTSCTHVYGSSDQTTEGRELCAEPGAAMEYPSGSVIYTQLFVRQMRPDGSVCRTVEVPGGRTYGRLSALRHHAPRYSEGTLTLPGSEECGTEIRPFIRVNVPRGPAVVVHWPGTNVSVTTDGS